MTVDSLPKVELHVHLEGTATPELVQRLADRNAMPLPERLLNEHGRFHYGDFLDFLRTYDMAASVIRTAEDYRDITYEYLRDCAAEGAIYVELTASPDHARLVGLTDEEHLDGIARGIDDARRLHGIEGRILISAVRNFGSSRRWPSPATPRPRPIPTSSASPWPATRPTSRSPTSPRRTRSPRRRASGARSTPASGRAPRACAPRSPCRSPASTTASGPSRIAALVTELAERRIVLNTCPTSNVVLGVFPGFDEHPLPQLRDAGVRLTLGSDDPPYFGATIGGEYRVCSERLGFSEEDLRRVTLTAIDAAFCDDELKSALRARVAAGS